MQIDKVMENFFSKALMSADDLLKVSWNMFSERFLKFLYIFLLAIVVVLFTSTILLALALASHSSAAIFAALFLVFVVLLAVTLVQNIMFFEIIKNKNVRIRQAFRKSLSKIRPYVGSFTLYFLVTLNLIVLFIFLGVFVSMSAIFASILSAAQGISIVFGILSAFLVFFMGVILTVLLVFAYVWQYFLFFDVIINNLSAREALEHSFSLINKNKQGIFERAGIFFVFYALIVITLTVLSYINSAFGALTEVAKYILGGWGVMFLYVMYENLKAISPAKADVADRQAVSLLLKSGAVVLVTAILLAVFSCMFFMAQLDFSSVAAETQTALRYSLFGI